MLSEETKMILDQLKVMNGKIDHLTLDVSGLKTDVSALKSDVSTLKSDVSALKSDVSELKETTKRHENDLRSIKLMLENEIRPSIHIIAEGHLDLNRKMNELVKIHADDEMLRLRVTALENDVREIKEHIA